MTSHEIIGAFFLAYALGWCWGAGVLAFKRLTEVAT